MVGCGRLLLQAEQHSYTVRIAVVPLLLTAQQIVDGVAAHFVVAAPLTDADAVGTKPLSGLLWSFEVHCV